jgi:Zn-dependent protease with chaperone function
MELISFVKSLSVFQVILINLALMLINLLFSLFLKYLVKRKYEKTQSVEETLYFQMKLAKYVQVIPIIATTFIAAFTITPKVKYFGKIGGFIVVMAIVMLMMTLSLVIQQLLLHDLNKQLRKTTASKSDQVKLLIRLLLFMFIPMILFFIAIILIDDNVHVSEQLENIIKPLLVCVMYIIFSTILPFFTKYMLKAKPMEDGEIKENLMEFLNNAGLSKVRLYLWPTKKNKVANAMVSGIITKNVYMSDYLLENFDTEESKSILAHEIGHIKKHHLLIRTSLFIGFIILVACIAGIFDWYEANYNEIPIWLGLSIFAVAAIVYMGLFVYFVKRVQEKQADAFVLDLNVDPKVYIRALYKLTKLNNMVMKLGKMDEKFQTHPSTAKRIKWIMEKSGISEEEFEEIIN